MYGWCDGHRTDNLLITELGKLVLVVQTWDLDRVAGMDIRRRQTQRSRLRHPEVGDHRFVVPLPFTVDGLPLFLGELVDLGGHSVMLAGANKVFCIIAARQFPVFPELPKRLGIICLEDIWLRLNGEVCMSQLMSPFIIWVRKDNGWCPVTCHRPHGVCSWPFHRSHRRLGRQRR